MALNRTIVSNVAWMTAGAAVLSVILVVTGLIRTDAPSGEEAVVPAEMRRIVARMRLDLVRESEAEKSAVLAENDEEAADFAEQARSALAEVEHGGRDLAPLVREKGSGEEQKLFARFSQAFEELQKVDAVLLGLAGRNTNVKAYALAFGPATQALRDLERALSGLVMSGAGGQDASRAASLAFTVQTGALRIQTMFAPHIAESSDSRMDEMESLMKGEDQEIRAALDTLSRLRAAADSPSLAPAWDAYSRFWEIAERILALSRENSNVRSLALSLDRKRKAFLQCQAALAQLQGALPEPQPAAGKFGRQK